MICVVHFFEVGLSAELLGRCKCAHLSGHWWELVCLRVEIPVGTGFLGFFSFIFSDFSWMQ